MKYKIPKKQKEGSLLKENNSLDPIYEGGMIPAAVSSYKYTMKDYDKLASKKSLNQVPSALQSGVMKAKVRGAINKGVKDVLLPTIGVGVAPIVGTPIISSAIASPSTFIGGIIGGMAGQVGTDKIVQKASGNKYSGWGDMVSKKTGLNPIVSEFTNPGGLIGGGIGAKIGNTIIKKGMPNVSKLNPWAFKSNPEAYYRGIGKSGLDDAIKSGLIKNPNYTPFKNDVHMSSMLKVAEDYASDYHSVFNPKFLQKGADKSRYIAEIPRKSLINPNSPVPYNVGPSNNPVLFHEFRNPEPIPINNVKFYKQHWLQGYKQINPKVNKHGELLNQFKRGGKLTPRK